MSNEASYDVGVRLKGDGSGLVGETKAGTDALAKLEEQARKTSQAMRGKAADSKGATDALKDQGEAARAAAERNGILQSVLQGLPAPMRAVASAGGLYGAALLGIGGGLAIAISRSEQFERSIGRMEAGLAAQGRAADISRAQISALVQEIALMPASSGAAARETVAAMATVRGVSADMLGSLARLTSDYATATGQTMPQAGKHLASSFADVRSGARALDQQLDLLSVSQLLLIERYTANGQQLEAQQVLYEALKNRISGLTEQAMTPLERSLDRLSHAWPALMQRIGDDSMIKGTASTLGQIVNAMSWIIEHSDSAGRAASSFLPGMGLLGAGRDVYEARRRGAPSMSTAYDARGFGGDARDLMARRSEESSKAAEILARQYDPNATRRRLEQDIRTLDAGLAERGHDQKYYQDVAAAVAVLKAKLADIDGELTARRRELERLHQLGITSAEQDLRGQHNLIEAKDELIRREALRARAERGRLEQLGHESEIQALIGEHAARQAQDDVARNAALKERNEHLKAEEELRRSREREMAEANRRFQAEFDRTASTVQSTLSQALITGFMRGGESGGEILKQAIMASVATLVLEPLIRPMLMPIAQGATALSMSMFGGASPGYAGSAAGAGAAFWGGAFGAGGGALGLGGADAAAYAGGAHLGGGGAAAGGAMGGMGWAPWLGAALYASQGQYGGAGGTLAGAYLGTMIMPGIGTAIGAVAGGLLGDSIFPGGGDGSYGPQSIGSFTQGVGRSFAVPGGGEGQAALQQVANAIAQQEQALVAQLRLNAGQIALVDQALGKSYTQIHWSGQSIPQWLQSGGADKLAQDRLKVIADVLGKSIEDLAREAQEAAEKLAKAFDDMVEATMSAADMTRRASQEAARAAQSYHQAAMSLAQAGRSLAVGDLSPLGSKEQLETARGFVQSLFSRALTGDMNALGGLGGAAATFLESSRNYNASSPAYTADFQWVQQLLSVSALTSEALATLRDKQDEMLTQQNALLGQIAAELAKPSPDLPTLEAARAELARITGQLSNLEGLTIDQNNVIALQRDIEARTAGEIAQVVAELTSLRGATIDQSSIAQIQADIGRQTTAAIGAVSQALASIQGETLDQTGIARVQAALAAQGLASQFDAARMLAGIQGTVVDQAAIARVAGALAAQGAAAQSDSARILGTMQGAVIDQARIAEVQRALAAQGVAAQFDMAKIQDAARKMLGDQTGLIFSQTYADTAQISLLTNIDVATSRAAELLSQFLSQEEQRRDDEARAIAEAKRREAEEAARRAEEGRTITISLGGIAGFPGIDPNDPRFQNFAAAGDPFVQFDNAPYRLHYGEAVIDAQTMGQLRRYGIPVNHAAADPAISQALEGVRTAIEKQNRLLGAMVGAQADAVKEQTAELRQAFEDTVHGFGYALARANKAMERA